MGSSTRGQTGGETETPCETKGGGMNWPTEFELVSMEQRARAVIDFVDEGWTTEIQNARDLLLLIRFIRNLERKAVA